MEPDEKTRAAYFKCENPDCRPYIVPNHPKDMEAADAIGYKRYKLDRCPEHSIWRGTIAMFHHPIFIAAMRYKGMAITGGGVLNQPANFGYLVSHARTELKWFYELLSERRSLIRKKN